MTLKEYVRHIEKRSRVLWIDEIPWELRNRVLRPLAMPHRMRRLERARVRRAIRESAALAAQWTEDWDTPACEWWYVCCDDRNYDLSVLRKDPRYEVRKGLEQCQVRRLDSAWFAANGYAVYAAAFRHYGTAPPQTPDQFFSDASYQAEYPGRETWGAFVGDRLVAWISCEIVDDVVMSSSSKSDPDYFKTKCNNALLYMMTRHYLRDRGFAYVTSGSRVLLHDSNVQDFKERMGYRKVFCPLRVELNPVAALVGRFSPEKLLRRSGLGVLLKGPLDRLEAFEAMIRVARACDSIPERAVAPEAMG